MLTLTEVHAATGPIIFGALFVLWLLSLVLKDVSIVDIFWGLGFALNALVCWWLLENPGLHASLMLTFTALWGGRLALHIGTRNIGHGEDPRYAAMRESVGPFFAYRALVTVFFLQGALMLLVAMPTTVAISANSATFGGVGIMGSLVFAVGFLFEAIGDWQLRRFKADPQNKDRVLDTGLWRYTRHPNYFGDFVVWWGFYLMALEVPGVAWTFFGPLLMSVLLMRVSGVTLLEASLKKTKPAYADYIRKTSAFFPRPPRN